MRAIITVAGRRCRDFTRGMILLAAIVGLAQATASAANESGMWQPHHLQLDYLGFTATYTCEGLKIALRGLLQQSGAQHIAVTTGGPCGAARRLIPARLEFSTLKPAPAGAGKDAEIVPGSWHHVTISPQHRLLQRGGSCELVEEFQKKVLPLFTVRNVKANLNCVPFQSTGYLYSLSFDVFAPSNAKLISGPDVR